MTETLQPDLFLFGLRSRMLARSETMRGESGNALIEIALLFSMLAVPMMLATSQLGLLAFESIEVSSAANAGAAYAAQSITYAADTTGTVAAAQAEAADLGSSLTVTPTSYYVCSLAPGGTQYTGSNAQSNATAACTGNYNRAIQYVRVETSVSVLPLVKSTWLPNSFTLTSTAVTEVQQ